MVTLPLPPPPGLTAGLEAKNVVSSQKATTVLTGLTYIFFIYSHFFIVPLLYVSNTIL